MVKLNISQYCPPAQDINRFGPYGEASSRWVQARGGWNQKTFKQYNHCLVGICHVNFSDTFGWEILHLATLLCTGKVPRCNRKVLGKYRESTGKDLGKYWKSSRKNTVCTVFKHLYTLFYTNVKTFFFYKFTSA